jgi:hypothetical protein
MILATITKDELINFIPTKHHSQLITIYSEIRTDLIEFLNLRNIIRQVNFKRTIQVDDKSIGNEYNKQWNSFINHLYHSIKPVFQEQNVTCIDPHELAVDISNRYLNLNPKWARRGQTLSGKFQFNKIYTIHDNDIQVARTDVDVKVEIDETCEDNWLDTNMYRVSYDVEMTLKGLTADGHKVRALCEVINRDGTDTAIEYIKSIT